MQDEENIISLFDEEEVRKSYVNSICYDLALEKATLMLKDGIITLDNVKLYFPELLENDIKEIEAEIKKNE